MQPDSAKMRQQANYNAMRCSTMAKATNPITLALVIVQKMQESGMTPVQSIKTAETALYCLNALEYGDEEGIEINRISKKLGFKVPSTALRIFYMIADNPDKVRGGKPLGWFSIRENYQDGRYMNIMLNERGAEVKRRMMYSTMAKDLSAQRIQEDVEELRAFSKTHYHLQAETAHFTWLGFETSDWGRVESKPIPLQSGYEALPISARKSVDGENYWWIDEKTGHVWKGHPQSYVATKLNPYKPNTIKKKKDKSLLVDYKEALMLEKSKNARRVRNEKGMWELYKVDAAIDLDPPVAIVMPLNDKKMDNYLAERYAEWNNDAVALEDILAKVDYELNKNDFNRFRQRFTQFLENERRQRDEQANALERGAREADKMSRQKADDANMVARRAQAMPTHMVPDKQDMLNQANELSKDSARYDADSAAQRDKVFEIEKQMAEMQKALNELKGKK